MRNSRSMQLSGREWSLTALIALLIWLFFAADLSHARASGAPLAGTRFLPFLVAVAWLPPKAVVPLGLWALGIKPLSLALAPAAMAFKAASWTLDFAVEAVAVALCVWFCQQRWTLQQTRNKLRKTLNNSLRASALIHEVRQPIALLLQQSRVLLQQHEQKPDQPSSRADDYHALVELHKTAENLVSITQTMDALLRCNTPPATEAVDLSALVCAQLEQQRVALQTEAVRLYCRGLDQSYWLEGNAAQLRVLIKLLINNAREALCSTPATQRRLAVVLSQQACKGLIRLSVSDSGPGLASCDLEDLRLNSSKATGLGLGLYIAEQIAMVHSGSLVMGRDSELGGASVQLTLPQAAIAAPFRAATATAQPGAPAVCH
ncbi:MAG: HAMP domain-containing histidine kinase [Cyanobacteria bacterium K_DeepCast_35m_m2_155]|nr:HAMP domain-containing histidine kinase [Cyanobacteria bacterium K_DeepCast_35m_m2_155]